VEIAAFSWRDAKVLAMGMSGFADFGDSLACSCWS